ncbi:MAG: beta-galactosidase trimerization domain-containing protein [Phycisphaerae bacterium]
MTRLRLKPIQLCVPALIAAFATAALAQEDAYEKYVKTSKDFQAVKQDKAWCLKAFPSWTYMPWTFQWTIGYTDESGKWSLDNGYNGAFIDWGNIGDGKSKTGKLDWINKFKLRFYMDHTAAKRYLHLWDGNEMKPNANQVHSGGVRSKPVNAAMADTLKDFIRKHVEAVKSAPFRAAYALDDEISWGHFVHPCMWCVTDDREAYAKWLAEIYGPSAPKRSGWITYNDIWPKLKTWSVADFDASQLMDQWTFNDSYWNNFIGGLVEYANSIDPDTPCGFVGGQAPNAFGGYDYAKIMKKVQFIEAYNLGSSQAIIRSFNPRGAIPAVTTHFHKNVDDDIWQTWYYLAHGNRGFIGWVEGWFDGQTPKPWHARVAPHYREAGSKIGPLLSGAEWVHDGVAIYYSHASIQLGWILDAEAHGKTWINRNGDEKLGASHLVRHAWENMLRDEGIQYNFISYADVVRDGVPKEYKVLILPAVLCLSDAEARRIKEFVQRGGTLIADYMPGLWDQHGKGRPGGGALDDVFGVRHDPKMKAADLFGGRLWCEVDQDVNFSYKSYEQFLTNKSTCQKDASGFNKAVLMKGMPVNHINMAARQMGDSAKNAPAGGPGPGTAVLMNLSPQWYNAYRVQGFDAAKKREVFMKHIRDAGVRPWVSITSAGQREFGHEITYWQKDGRTYVFIVYNPELSGSQTGGGNSAGLKTETIKITLEFAAPVKGARDERTGKDLGDRKAYDLNWTMNEAVVLSFAGGPARKP